MVSHHTLDRFLRALSGDPGAPVVAGMSFVDPSLLPGPSGRAAVPAPALALARACADLHLDFAFVPSWEPWAAEAVRALRAAGIVAVWAVPGALTPVLERLGAAAGLRMIATGAPELAAGLDAATAAAVDSLEAGIAAGADVAVVADDLAGADGPLASPVFLDAEVFPRLALLATLAGEAGLPAMLHCDGVADALYDSARRAGFSAVHGDCGGATRVPHAFAAARTAGLALVGGIAAADLSDLARAATAGAAASAQAARGGLLVADDGGVATAAECAALFAALGAARR